MCILCDSKNTASIRAQPGVPSQEFSAKSSQPGVSQPTDTNHESTARNPRRSGMSQDSPARKSQQGLLDQKSSDRIFQPGVLSQESSARHSASVESMEWCRLGAEEQRRSSTLFLYHTCAAQTTNERHEADCFEDRLRSYRAQTKQGTN